MKKKLLFLFLFFGIFLSRNNNSYGFWEEPFSFINDEGNKVIIYKNQSFCRPETVVRFVTGTYGTSKKTFSIYPLCNFGGVEITYSGLRYQYKRSVRCDSNIYICKAAGKYGLLNNYERKRRKIEDKLKKEVSLYNKDFEINERKAKQARSKYEQRQRAGKKRFREEAHLLSYRDNCLSIIKNGKKINYDKSELIDFSKPPSSGVQLVGYRKYNSCFLYAYYEPLFLEKWNDLPKPSIRSQIPEKYLVARVDRTPYLWDIVVSQNNFARDARKWKWKGYFPFITCFQGGYINQNRYNDRKVFCKFTDQYVVKGTGIPEINMFF